VDLGSWPPTSKASKSAAQAGRQRRENQGGEIFHGLFELTADASGEAHPCISIGVPAAAAIPHIPTGRPNHISMSALAKKKWTWVITVT
jgi:hypothetical protein